MRATKDISAEWQNNWLVINIKLCKQLKIWSLPEYILSSTRGTAQNIVGFNAPMSSTNNLTSYKCTQTNFSMNPLTCWG
jgi:hypothetical protein